MKLKFPLLIIGIALLAFVAGWYGKGIVSPLIPPQSLRLGGYTFIDPLLACNINNSNVYVQNKVLAGQLSSIINTHVGDGDISKASIYFTNLGSGEWADVNGD